MADNIGEMFPEQQEPLPAAATSASQAPRSAAPSSPVPARQVFSTFEDRERRLEKRRPLQGRAILTVVGGPDDPAFVQRFAAIATGPDAAGLDISFCGPQGLLRRVRARMREHGLDPARLHHERFEFR